MIMEAGGIVAIGLQGSDHAGESLAVPGDFLEKLLDCGIEALAQEAEELAIVLEAEPEHFEEGFEMPGGNAIRGSRLPLPRSWAEDL
jgi:hypothetical protein